MDYTSIIGGRDFALSVCQTFGSAKSLNRFIYIPPGASATMGRLWEDALFSEGCGIATAHRCITGSLVNRGFRKLHIAQVRVATPILRTQILTQCMKRVHKHTWLDPGMRSTMKRLGGCGLGFRAYLRVACSSRRAVLKPQCPHMRLETFERDLAGEHSNWGLHSGILTVRIPVF